MTQDEPVERSRSKTLKIGEKEKQKENHGREGRLNTSPTPQLTSSISLQCSSPSILQFPTRPTIPCCTAHAKRSVLAVLCRKPAPPSSQCNLAAGHGKTHEGVNKRQTTARKRKVGHALNNFVTRAQAGHGRMGSSRMAGSAMW